VPARVVEYTEGPFRGRILRMILERYGSTSCSNGATDSRISSDSTSDRSKQRQPARRIKENRAKRDVTTANYIRGGLAEVLAATEREKCFGKIARASFFSFAGIGHLRHLRRELSRSRSPNNQYRSTAARARISIATGKAQRGTIGKANTAAWRDGDGEEGGG